MMEKLYILPMGDAKGYEASWLCNELAKEFDLACELMGSCPLPKGSYNEDREQYLSTAILDAALPFMPSDAKRLLVVVGVDLYVPGLNFVFGEASPSWRAAVISFARLHQSVYGLKEDTALFKRRLLTEAVHELGHTFSLGHCKDSHCVMYFSNTLADTDRKGPHFCKECKGKLGIKSPAISGRAPIPQRD